MTYFILRRNAKALKRFLASLHPQRSKAMRSFIMNWAFRGRSEGEDRLAHLFTVFPPLMNIVAFVAVVAIFLIAFAFLKVETSIATLVIVVLLAFPFYYSADAFEMYLMARAAKNAGVAQLSEEDKIFLGGAELALNQGTRYFRNLSISLALIIGALTIVHGLTQSLGLEFAWFAFLVSAIAANTVIRPRTSVGQINTEVDQSLEVALPTAGDHLSYGAPILLDAHRNRLMRRFLRSKSSESEEPKPK